jgi:hypothetical protein
MGKADLNINKKANGGQITGGKVSKSETDEKVLALIKSQQEDIENLTKAITSVLSAPVRRSITALSEVPELKKSEPAKAMSRKEVDAFISENVHKMTKSDRELWLQFVDNKVPASKLAPMLDRLTSK